MEILLLRHGRTAGNMAGRYIGRTDDPLCSYGVEDAKNAGAVLETMRVFVSPLSRARQTAKLCFPNAVQTVVDGLREMDFGDFENRTADEMENDAAYRQWVDGWCKGPCPNGESIESFAGRVARAFQEVIVEAMAAGEERVCVVAHAGTLMAIMWSFSEEKKSYYDWFVPNCQGWKAELLPESWTERPVLYGCEKVEALPPVFS